MDTGPVLAQARLPIHTSDTTATLSARLAELGASSLVETLPRWLSGDLAPIPQDELPGEVSLCHLIKKDQGRIDWQVPAAKNRTYDPRLYSLARRIHGVAGTTIQNLGGRSVLPGRPCRA